MSGSYITALYYRLSQEDSDLVSGTEHDESSSIKGQRDLLTAYVETMPDLAKGQIIEFYDDGYSGTNFDRPGFQILLDQAKKGKINCIVVKDFSRFGRNYIEVGNYLEQVFPFLGVRFISVNDGFDSIDGFGAAGAIDVAFKNLIYDLYSKDLSQKALSGRKTKAQRGEYLGAYAPYGYTKARDTMKRLVVDEEAAVVVKRIFEMAAAECSKVEIARILNDGNIPSPAMLRKYRGDSIIWRFAGKKSHWTQSTVISILKDERYLGKSIYGKRTAASVGSKKSIAIPRDNWIIVPNTHEPIISQELFDKVQAGFRMGKKKTGRSNTSIPLLGKLRCACCNHVMKRKNLKSENALYHCITRRTVSSYSCFMGGISEKDVEEQILSCLITLTTVMNTSNVQEKRAVDYQDTLYDKVKQIKELQYKAERLKTLKLEDYEKYKAGNLDRNEFITRREKATKEIDEINCRIIALESDMEAARQTQEPADQLIEVLNQYSPFTSLNKSVVDTFVDAIYVNENGSLKIIWTFKDEFMEPLEKDFVTESKKRRD